MKKTLIIISLLAGLLLPALGEEVLFSLKDLKKTELWLTETKVKVDVEEKDGIKITIPENKEKITVSLNIKKLGKIDWTAHSLLKLEIENKGKEELLLKLRFERRALDDCLIQPENPRFDKDLTLLPGKNSFEVDVTGASRNPGWLVRVEKINFIFVSKEKAGKTLFFRNIKVEQGE